MSWTESDLIADLNSRFEAVATPTINEVEDTKGITWMMTNVLEIGKSEATRVPTAHRKNISYYVKDRGEATEEAWYAQDEPINQSAKDPIDGLTGNLLTAGLYRSETLRKKVLGQLCTSAQAIFWEDAGTASHAERLVLAREVLANPDKYLNSFMVMAALDSNVRTDGAQVSDANVATVVNGWWTNIALSL